MEPAALPLRLISRKFFNNIPRKSAKSAKSGPKPVSKNWLRSTISSSGVVHPTYRPLLQALHGLSKQQDLLKSFRAALKSNNYSTAESNWKQIVKTSEPKDSTQINLKSWKQLAEYTGSYGPRLFMNALNDIVRHAESNPILVRKLVVPTGSPLDSYILGNVASRLGQYDKIPLALMLFNPDPNMHGAWVDNAAALGLTALLESSQMEGSKVVQIMQGVKIPAEYRIPPYLISRLICHLNASSVDAFKVLADNGVLGASKPLDELLRRLYSSSDYGAITVREYALKILYPWHFYPFLVKRLCEQLANGDSKAKQQLDHLFDNEIAQLASTKPSLVLHLLVLRIIATDGVQATSPVLNRWAETDENGVSESTWLLLFQAFRRMGRPDKCSEVLGRMLKARTEVSLPFVGEYLLYTAQFYNLETYLTTLIEVIPEMQPVIDVLDINTYSDSLPFQSHEAVPQSSKYKLTVQNRDFPVHRIHESWLAITYQAVLSTVETTDEALHLFEKYVHYVTKVSWKPATSLRVVDQFVVTLCTLPRDQKGIEAAEYVFRVGLEKLKLKRPVDGKNHSKSLELLCYKLVQSGQNERAVTLFVEAVAQYMITPRAATIKPWIMKLPKEIRDKLLHWARHHAGVIIKNDVHEQGPSQDH